MRPLVVVCDREQSGRAYFTGLTPHPLSLSAAAYRTVPYRTDRTVSRLDRLSLHPTPLSRAQLHQPSPLLSNCHSPPRYYDPLSAMAVRHSSHQR